MQRLRFNHMFLILNVLQFHRSSYGFMHILDAVVVHKSSCNFMKRTLALVNLWFINMFCFNTFHKCFIGCLVPGCIHHAVARFFVQSSMPAFTFMQIYETSSGNGQSMDYETSRFVYTSMKRGLAMLKVWNMRIVFVLLVSVRYSVSS